MDPLRAVEDILGEVHKWPSYAIYDIFVEVPSPNSVKKVAAFMYGKGVPVYVAVRCFNACNGQLRSFVSNAMETRYAVWDKSRHTKRKAEYYSMFFFKKWLKINGEKVWPEVTVTDFGIESTGYPQLIKSTIDHVRSCKDC